MPRGFGERNQIEGPCQLRPRSQDSGQALVHLCQARLALALRDQHPAAKEGADPRKQGKPLRGRQGQQGVGLRLERGRLTVAVKQDGRPLLGEPESKGMGQRLGQGQRLLRPQPGLRLIAQTPQGLGRRDQAPHPGC